MNITRSPNVTVLMPVYNGEQYLREAIESVLKQTYTDFEFLIINDGSTDESVEIIDSYHDPRIRLVHNKKNLKLIATLNKGLDLARGKYIARMDCDDVCLPERLSRQVSLLQENPDVGVCGTSVKTTGEPEERIFKYPTKDETIRCQLIFESPFAHPTVMFRRDLILKFGIYFSQENIHAEDYDFWVRLSRYCKFANLEEALLLYRIHPESVCSLNQEAQETSADAIRLRQIHELGIEPTKEELFIHHCINRYKSGNAREYIDDVSAWLIKLKLANGGKFLYPEPAFSQALGERWFEICYYSSCLGLSVWKAFWNSPLSSTAPLSFKQKVLFAVKCGLRGDDVREI